MVEYYDQVVDTVNFAWSMGDYSKLLAMLVLVVVSVKYGFKASVLGYKAVKWAAWQTIRPVVWLLSDPPLSEFCQHMINVVNTATTDWMEKDKTLYLPNCHVLVHTHAEMIDSFMVDGEDIMPLFTVQRDREAITRAVYERVDSHRQRQRISKMASVMNSASAGTPMSGSVHLEAKKVLCKAGVPRAVSQG